MSQNIMTFGFALALGSVTTLAAVEALADSGTTAGPRRTPHELVDALHAAFGEHHARAVHAKGVILEGVFTPDPQAASITRAAHLQKTSSKIVVRFSDFTGLPDIPDTADGANPRGLAIRFIMPDGISTDIVGHSFNGFPTATSDQFHELLIAISKSGPGAAKPTVLDGFLATHPIAKMFLTTQKTPASFATIAYFGVNAFEMINARGVSHFVRYQFVPEDGEQLLRRDEVAKKSADYLMTEIKSRVAVRPARFKVYAQLAEREDKIEDPSVAWPDTRKRVMLGTMEIQHLGIGTPEEDKALAFMPDRLPDGIKPADPMVTFRAKAYPISAQERR